MTSEEPPTPQADRRRWPWILVAVLLVVTFGGRLAVGLVPPPVVGVRVNALYPCPDSDNCVRSGASDPRHAITPLRCDADRMDEVVQVALSELERTELVEYTNGYAHLTSSSRWVGFVDDLELLAGEGSIDVRSAARLGQGDLGVNRDRVEQLREALDAAGICT